MKSIEDTLKLISDIADSLDKDEQIAIALVGGYATIAHGVGRTTSDVDFCLYADSIHKESSSFFFKNFRKVVPENFKVTLIEGSKMLDDSFKHDIIFLEDKSGEYPRIDFIIPRYKWELEGIRTAKPLEDIPFPVLPKPYLIAMKLKAGGPKDDYDIIELYRFLRSEEKRKTDELAKLIRKDKRLSRLIEPKRAKEADDDSDLLIS